MSGLSRGAPDKVTFKLRGDGTPIHPHEEPDGPDPKMEARARRAAVRAAAAGAGELIARARQVLPGGVNLSLWAGDPDPVFIREARGALLIAEDAREYLDWDNASGANILGHADPEVIAAVAEAAGRGISPGGPTIDEVVLAEAIRSRMTSIEMLRLFDSGRAAAAAVVALARQATSRETTLGFAGAGTGVDAAGVSTVLPWNDRDAVDAALAGGEVAALVLEPLPFDAGSADGGLTMPANDFLDFLREKTRTAGTLLIFDETDTGFRVAPGGAQELYGVDPDLTLLGKVIGGGLPLAALGGSADLLERLPSTERQSSHPNQASFTGNPLAVAAGLATVDRLDQAAYERIGELTARLARGLEEQVKGKPLAVAATRGMVGFAFDSDSLPSDPTAAHVGFRTAMLERGIRVPPTWTSPWFITLAHDETMIDRTVLAVGDALTEAF